MRNTWALTAIGLGLASPAMAQKVTVADATAAQANSGRYAAQSRPCRWQQPALGVTVGVATFYANQRAKADTGQEAPYSGIPKAEACNGPVDLQAQAYAAQVALEWLSRQRIMYSLTQPAGWGQGLVNVSIASVNAGEPLRAMLEKQFATNQPVQFKAWAEALQRETITDLTLLCASRKTKGIKTGERACPPVPPNYASFVPISITRVEAVEFLASRLPEQAAKGARGEFGIAYRVVGGMLALTQPRAPGSRCEPGELVVFPDAPDTVDKPGGQEMTLRRRARDGAFGRVLLKQRANSNFDLVTPPPGAPIEELRTGPYAITFDMCLGD
ncbi:MAG: hypothetical protein EOP60_07935 [Sphingomonadales bacterium]|nr:MAG: hypothetical protein EOP60_07935 [Sphingomonadales bacterium]